MPNCLAREPTRDRIERILCALAVLAGLAVAATSQPGGNMNFPTADATAGRHAST